MLSNISEFAPFAYSICNSAAKTVSVNVSKLDILTVLTVIYSIESTDCELTLHVLTMTFLKQ